MSAQTRNYILAVMASIGVGVAMSFYTPEGEKIAENLPDGGTDIRDGGLATDTPLGMIHCPEDGVVAAPGGCP